MAFVERHCRNDALTKQTDFLASNRATLDRKPETTLFYEFEAAIVVDAIYDEKHPEVKDKTIIADQYPQNLNGNPPENKDTDYGWIGRIKFRFITTDVGVDVDELQWADPLEITGVTEIPLVNEMVAVVNYMGKFYYTRRINSNGFINATADFELEPYYGGIGEKIKKKVDSTINVSNSGDGSLGDVFKYNNRIRALRRYEGDTIIESRFGSSIRFGGYGPDDAANKGDSKNVDYPQGTGNPWVLIRNRQAPADPKNKVTTHPKTYVTESINNDGSSIHITSGITVSDFKTTCKKVMLQDGTPEEQPKFSPSGLTKFKYPTLDGDQIVVNSDRLVFQARGKEFLQYAKQRFSVVTDDEFTVDAHDKIVMTSNMSTVLNSPTIFLGEVDFAEPALLGRTTTYWLNQLCDWLLNQTNWQIELCEKWLVEHEHDTKKDPTLSVKSNWKSSMKTHVDALKSFRKELEALRDELPKNMSQRVFLVGGGGAPGHSGGKLKSDTSEPSQNSTNNTNTPQQNTTSPTNPINQEYELVRLSSGTAGEINNVT